MIATIHFPGRAWIPQFYITSLKWMYSRWSYCRETALGELSTRQSVSCDKKIGFDSCTDISNFPRQNYSRSDSHWGYVGAYPSLTDPFKTFLNHFSLSLSLSLSQMGNGCSLLISCFQNGVGMLSAHTKALSKGTTELQPVWFPLGICRRLLKLDRPIQNFTNTSLSLYQNLVGTLFD